MWGEYNLAGIFEDRETKMHMFGEELECTAPLKSISA